LLDADALRRLLPGFRLHAGYGVLTTRGGVLLADRIAAALVTWLAAHGATLRAQTSVATIDIARATIALDSGDTLRPEMLVIAAGAATARLIPELAQRVGARRQIVVYLKPPPAHHEAWRQAPVFVELGSDDKHWGAPPVCGTDLKLAAGAQSRAVDGCERESRAVTGAEAMALLRRFRPLIPDLDAYEMLGMKACVYATGMSGLFVEALDTDRKVWVIGGGDGGDYKRAPAVALALAARLMSACARS
jgi:hypothetical protein